MAKDQGEAADAAPPAEPAEKRYRVLLTVSTRAKLDEPEEVTFAVGKSYPASAFPAHVDLAHLQRMGAIREA